MKSGTDHHRRLHATAAVAADLPPALPPGEAAKPRASLPSLFLWGLVRPRDAGRRLVSARAWHGTVLLVVGLIGYAALLIGLVLWGETFYLQGPDTSSVGGPPYPLITYAQQSVATVLGEWYADGVHSPPVVIVAAVFFGGPLLLLVVALLNLPLVQRAEPAWPAVVRTLRLMPAVLVPIGWGTLLVGVAFNLACQLRVGSVGELWGPPVPYREPVFVGFALAACGTWCLIAWLRRAAEGARGAGPGVLSPRCAGCGYDLTHRPAEGRCSECGLALTASLDPATRPGAPWAQRRTLRNWATTTRQLLTAPAAFYRDLRLRDAHEPEVEFAAWTYVALGTGALLFDGCAFLAAVARHGTPPAGFLPFAAAVAVVVTAFGVAGCWAGHRVNAALVGTLWLARRPLRDGRWAARIIGYECAYLWVFCALWGVLALSFLLWGDWVTALLGRHPFGPRYFGVPPEPLLVLGSTAALVLLWWWRYRIAYRAVCWSNF